MNNKTIYHLLKWTNYNEDCQYFFSSIFLEKRKPTLEMLQKIFYVLAYVNFAQQN